MVVSSTQANVAHVRAIGFSNIILTPVSSLVERERNRKFSHEAYETFVERNEDLTVMIEEAISAVLKNCCVRPETIEAVYFATESHWEEEIPRLSRMAKLSPPRKVLRNGLIGVLHDLGLKNAYPTAFWMSDCGNACEALLHAKAAIQSGRHKRILVVAADRRHPDLPRIELDNHVYSDVAAAILVDTIEGHIIGEGVGKTNNDRLYIADPKKALKTILDDLSDLRREFEFRTKKSIDQYDHYILGNWSSIWLDTATDFLGLAPSKVKTGTAQRISHAQGSDLFLNLDHLTRNISTRGEKGIFISTTPRTAHLIEINL